MKKLFYNVYSNISDETYREIEAKLVMVENKMSDILLPQKWRITAPISKSDYLAVDFLLDDAKYHGNIGVGLNGDSEKVVFTFGVTKNFDANGIRYFLREDIFRDKPFSFFEHSIELYLNSALLKYHEWSDEQIVSQGEKVILK